MPKSWKNRRGFTLIEVMTAVLLITVSLTAVIGMSLSNTQNQNANQNAVIASMLAQEGLELVRKLRDENWRAGATGATNWKLGGPADTVDIIQDDNYAIDYDGTIDDTPDLITDPECQIYLDESPQRNYYTHDSGGGNIPTQFYRLIEITDNTFDDYVAVRCTVQFTKPGGAPYTYTAETTLYNWF